MGFSQSIEKRKASLGSDYTLQLLLFLDHFHEIALKMTDPFEKIKQDWSVRFLRRGLAKAHLLEATLLLIFKVIKIILCTSD